MDDKAQTEILLCSPLYSVRCVGWNIKDNVATKIGSAECLSDVRLSHYWLML